MKQGDEQVAQSSARGYSLVVRLVGIASLIAVIAGLYLGKEFLVPLSLAVLFTLTLSPVVGLLQRTGLPRVLSVVVAVVLAFGLLGGMSYFVFGQVSGLAGEIPKYQKNLQAKLESIKAPFSKTMEKVQGAVDGAKKEAAPPPKASVQGSPENPEPVKVEIVGKKVDAFGVITGILGSLVSLAGNAAVVILLVIFFLIYQSDIRDRLVRLAGGGSGVPLATQSFGDAVDGVSRFLFLQAIVNVSYGLCLGIGLYALGVPNALLWGFTATLFRFIPYLGPIVAGVFPVLLSIAISPGWGRPGLVTAFIVVLELVSNNVIEPWVYGKRTGLSPFAVVLTAVFWGWLWGAMGLLLSVPLTLCLMTLGKYAPGLGFLKFIFGDEPALGPGHQIYNRLFGGNTGDAAEVIEKESEGKPLSQVYDELLIPVLRMTDEACQQGRVDQDRRSAIFASIAEIQDDLGDAARLKIEKEGALKSRGVGVLCLPVSDKADELAGGMLAQLLSNEGFRAEAVALEKMTAGKSDLVEKGAIDIVVLSVLPPSILAKGRYLYRWVRRRLPEVPIVVGLWGVQGDSKALESQFASDGQAVFVTTLAQAMQAIQEAAPAAILRRDQAKDALRHPAA